MRGIVGPVLPSARAVRGADPERLRKFLATSWGVDPRQLFLTHGATEGNAWVTLFVARRARARGGRPVCRVWWPEYPPLVDVARWAGFRISTASEPAQLAVLSNPRNPEGRWVRPRELLSVARGAREILVDETYREFARSPTFSGEGRRGVWRTGTFTKFFGGDSIRVGFVVAPEESREAFARFLGLFADAVPPYSIAAAIATWQARERIRRAVAQVVERNVAHLRAVLPQAPALAAPLFFDRPGHTNGRTLAESCLRSSVLVCPGDLFGDPRGVRVGLTRPSFPADLVAYLAVRERTRLRARL